MKKSLSVLLFVLLIYSSYSFDTLSTKKINTDTTNIPIVPKVKKVNKKSKEHCFEYSNPYKMSGLCRLIQMGNYKAVKTCIENGVDINKISLKLTPAMYAARHNRIDILKLLIKEGANLNAKSSNGFTALKWAKQTNAKEAYALISRELKK